MSDANILDRLDGIRQSGHEQYVARCPAHQDRSPSLSIRFLDDGRTLLHCFAGCETEDVLAALGMTFSDLMPERIGGEHAYGPSRQRFNARAALECVYHEALVSAVLAEDMAAGKSLTDEDHERLLLAASRLADAMDAATPLREVR